MNKVVTTAEEAVRDIPSGATLMLGGFGLCGIPENLIDALVARGLAGTLGTLHTISNNMGVDGFGMGRMLEAGMIASHTGSYVGENKLLEEKVIRGELDLTLVPQGTLAERIRAGGAGIPAFYTPTGLGTLVAEGKPTASFDGRTYVQERGLKADYALVKAWKGDTAGNLIYRRTARNFNPMMATAGTITIAEVEILVEPGDLDPDLIVTPGIYVQRILKGAHYEKRIERRTVVAGKEGLAATVPAVKKPREQSIRREYPGRPVVGVGAIVLRTLAGDGAVEVLLARRANPPAQGEWSLPGGMVELGERMEEAVLREVLEETGLLIEAGPIVEVFDSITLDSDPSSWNGPQLPEDRVPAPGEASMGNPQPQNRVRFHYVLIDFVCQVAGGTLACASDATEVCWQRIDNLRSEGDYALRPKTLEVIRKAQWLYPFRLGSG